MLVVLSKSLDASFNAWEMTSLYDKVKDEALSTRDFSVRVLSILNAHWLHQRPTIFHLEH